MIKASVMKGLKDPYKTFSTIHQESFVARFHAKTFPKNTLKKVAQSKKGQLINTISFT